MNRFKQMSNEEYAIFPVPQAVSYPGGEAKITDGVNIVIQSELHQATLPMLQEMLTRHGFVHTITDHYVEDQTNLFLVDQDKKDEWTAFVYSDQIPEVKHPEGYSLIINGSSVSNLAIVGSDSNGIHHGVVTLRSILDQSSNRVLKNCIVTDYPEIRYRGYIEGFYGYPWSHEDRMDLMQFGGEQKLNTYIYAPKDDPYHRKNWRELYPADKAKEIAELAAAGHENHMNFVWTIHPGDSIDLSSEEDAESAILKLEQLYALGVRQFGILFDDIGGIPDGAEQARFINRIDAEFVKVKGDIEPLITVGTRYCEAWGPSMTGYFKPFVDTLHDDVEIMWTGSATMSNIAKEQYDAPRREINSAKPLSVWWNYPVNDYCDSKILMGKIQNLSSDLDNVNGFFANPMNQSQASKQALFCIADHNWNTDAFDCEKSYSASFRALAPEVAEELEIFASNSCYLKDDGGKSGTFLFDESWDLKEDVQRLIESVEQGLDVSEYASRLLKSFIRMEEAADIIDEKCSNRHLVQELEPFLNAFKRMAQAAKQVIHAVIAFQAGDFVAMEQHNEAAQKLLTSMEACKVHRLKEGVPHDFTVDVGTLVMKPFIADMIVKVAVAAGTEQKLVVPSYEKNNIALQSLGVTASASSYTDENANASKVIDGAISTGKWCATELRPFLTVDLQQPCTVKQYRIVNCGHPEAGETRLWNTMHVQILASHDGEHFTVIDEVTDNSGDVINRILADEITAQYFRLQVIEPAQTSNDGSGHTRIYAFELYDERYPEHAAKVLSSDIQIGKDGSMIIHHVHPGDVISLFHTLNEDTPFAVSEKVDEHSDQVVFAEGTLGGHVDRVFVERISGYSLPSVRTSKGILV
ncbi:beta-N-acetylglucosaminidase domain-containing protein [Paenibacillus sp. Marseille-Q4541]|uniref:beta-N-acetylglucosaminidase domain-containing protein n=1 Tax=Paenibacillus sp. Marseille-Q4541 TaxID=2831522 RepID=UPI001BAB4A6B|nr:beta-N-acetylglucosaminidase domain-containing protein [Paenibacillus sp. Marseille-Q4541]